MPAGCESAWRAFCRLSGDRPMAISGYALAIGGVVLEPRPGGIPFAALDRWARRHAIEGEAFDLLARLVDELDAEYIAWHAERAAERARSL